MIRTEADRAVERRAWQDRVNRALRESSPADAARLIVGRHVGEDGRLPRIPVIGFEAGAIRGSIPHRSRLVR